MKIQILGTGCHNCLELEMRLAEAVARSGRTDVEVRREEEERLIRYHMPLESIPGLLINGQLVSQRDVPTVETLLEWLKAVPV